MSTLLAPALTFDASTPPRSPLSAGHTPTHSPHHRSPPPSPPVDIDSIPMSTSTPPTQAPSLHLSLPFEHTRVLSVSERISRSPRARLPPRPPRPPSRPPQDEEWQEEEEKGEEKEEAPPQEDLKSPPSSPHPPPPPPSIREALRATLRESDMRRRKAPLTL